MCLECLSTRPRRGSLELHASDSRIPGCPGHTAELLHGAVVDALSSLFRLWVEVSVEA